MEQQHNGKRNGRVEEEEDLGVKRGKRRTYSFIFPEDLSLYNLRQQFLHESIKNKTSQERKSPIASHLEGAFICESTKKAFIFFKQGKEPSFFSKYSFVIKDTIKRWNAKTKNFDPQHPPIADSICWDYRLGENNVESPVVVRENSLKGDSSPSSPKSLTSIELVRRRREWEEAQGIIQSTEIDEDSKLKKKQNRKSREKSQRNFSMGTEDEDENLILDLYQRIRGGQSFYSIFEEFLKAETEIKTLRMLNRMSTELLTFEKNIVDSKRLATLKLFEEPIYIPNQIEFDKYKNNYDEWNNRLHAISDKITYKKNFKQFSEWIEKGWNPVAFIDLIENKKVSLEDIKDEITRKIYPKEIQQLFELLETYLKMIEHVENSKKKPII